ncbi:MAG TPA: asparagine--tRNA ligase, partial [Holophaga sp.]|nr:asparagine--tRNA ligase [Holophaga sp.]
AYLTVSGQLAGETMALALSNIYTFGPTFRAENSNTTRHLAEFWMVEPEMAFYDLKDNADLAEDFLKHLFRTVLNECADDMAFFAEFIEKTAVSTLEHIVNSPFERVTYTEAIRLLEKSGEAFDYPVAWGMDIQTEHERYLAEKLMKRPVIVTDYPKDIKAFYMRMNDDGKTVAAMDVLVPRLGEIIGGSQREERLDVLLKRMGEMGLDEKPYWWYLDTRRFGSVPHAGFGLGFERTVQFVTGMGNIRDVILYPRTPRAAEF